MPLRSMTGHACVSTPVVAGGSLEAEVRSVNGRWLEVRVRHPFGGAAGTSLEPGVRAAVEAAAGRGRVDVVLTLRRAADTGDHRVDARELAEAAQQLADLEAIALRAGLEVARLNILQLLEFSRSRTTRDGGVGPAGPDPAVPPELEALVARGLGEWVAAREREGRALHDALVGLVAELRAQLLELDAILAAEPDRLRRMVDARLGELGLRSGWPAPELDRVRQEVAALLLRGDVTEECTRVAAHLDHVGEVLAAPARAGQGRALDFLCQELAREIGTIGAKIGALAGTRVVLAAKATLERLREQVQNVE